MKRRVLRKRYGHAHSAQDAADVVEALRLVRQARTLLRRAKATKAASRVAGVIHSVEGAARHADLQSRRGEM